MKNCDEPFGSYGSTLCQTLLAMKTNPPSVATTSTATKEESALKEMDGHTRSIDWISSTSLTSWFFTTHVISLFSSFFVLKYLFTSSCARPGNDWKVSGALPLISALRLSSSSRSRYDAIWNRKVLSFQIKAHRESTIYFCSTCFDEASMVWGNIGREQIDWNRETAHA